MGCSSSERLYFMFGCRSLPVHSASDTYVEEWCLSFIAEFQNSISLHSLVLFSQTAFSVWLLFWDIQIVSRYLLCPSAVKPAFYVSEETHLHWMYHQGTYEMKEMKTCVAVEIKWTKLILYYIKSVIQLLLICCLLNPPVGQTKCQWSQCLHLQAQGSFLLDNWSWRQFDPSKHCWWLLYITTSQ